ncbi:PQQ-binding-like beta-propeller repeat protein [Myxococcus llanfairpwllgwyngyllgogerychwyrndrobwllllantysiliogogogochensis]|uniref:PQQ-binding-like beta-propeller repeat protein n=1 Tax=Myxococcus llanfairpwllgwyngyllgogerychwyrndrobwllllantysiliogogogochensis TaxID=2590453 RepID=A0A540WMB7_9BACT|nr:MULTISPECIES: PQQ-binding-like beta-propeller repeat protein [Myxococcus]NTX36752.1 PQQ-binding-like beta-propeller repeat protein [Myxococcus sp. CA033]TQF10161.1 PQQ-binding-like beta-propeller repeat protein [Myxococcus llanfairpwllgwyngyllgogerychwyrndrobwllllantysiliogogogochensis]
MKKQLVSWRRWLGSAVAVGLLGGCSTLPRYGNPELPRTELAPPVDYFSVDWWAPLVAPTLLEYAPREVASPAYDAKSKTVIALTRDGVIRGVGPDGQIKWSKRTTTRFAAGAQVSDGVAFVPGGDGTLYALDAATGDQKWQYAAGESLATVPVIAEGLVLVASESDTLFAVKVEDGVWAWQYRRDPPSGFTVRGASTPLVRDGNVYVGFSDGYIVSLNMKDGGANWEKSLSGSGSEFLDVDTTPALDDHGQLYVASYKNGLFALEAESGELVWTSSVSGMTGLLAKGQMLFTVGDGRVDAYLAEDGRLLWSHPLGERSGQTPVFSKGMLIVPIQRSLLFLDPKTGQARVSWNPGDGVSATPFVAGSKLFVLSNNGWLYSLDFNGLKG